MTKKDQVLEHLRCIGSITPKFAYRYYRSFRLADIIFKLKKDGWDIRTERVKENGESFARYSLVKP